MQSSMQQPLEGATTNILPRHVPQVTSAVPPETQWRLYTALLILNDILLSGLGLILAAWIRYHVPLPIFNLEARPTVPSLGQVLFLFVPLWIAVFAFHGLYHRRNLLGGLREYAGSFRATAIGILLIVIMGFMQPETTPARGWVLLAWLLATLFVIGGRFTLRHIAYYLRLHGWFLSPALIVGSNGEAHSLAEQLRLWRTSGLAVLGYVTDHGYVAPGGHRELGYKDLPVVGGLAELKDIVHRYGIEELILATSDLSQDTVLTIFKQFGTRPDINLRLSSGLYEIITTGLEVKEIASVPLVRVNPARIAGFDRVLKATLDMCLGISLLLLALPVMVVCAVAIRLDSPGPIFYRRRVMGLNGHEFEAFKFRTMYVDGDDILARLPELQAELAQTHKLKDDPRVTRIGRVLRRYSLDELPQLFNVLQRQMSVVGPRMISPEELLRYEHWDINLLTVLPGITGLWQVSGRSDVSYAERVRLDMRYIRNWSIWLDLHILLRTISVVARGQGAY